MSFAIEASTCGALLSMDRLPQRGESLVNGAARALGLERSGARLSEFPYQAECGPGRTPMRSEGGGLR